MDWYYNFTTFPFLFSRSNAPISKNRHFATFLTYFNAINPQQDISLSVVLETLNKNSFKKAKKRADAEASALVLFNYYQYDPQKGSYSDTAMKNADSVIQGMKSYS